MRAGVTIVAITLLGLGLRLALMGDSLFGDELSTYFVVTGHGLGRVLHLVGGHYVETSPPLFFVATWAVDKLGASLRLVSLLADVAAIPMTWRLGRDTVGRAAALAGAAVMSLSPFLVFFSSEARPFALVLALTLGSTLALLRALDTGRLAWWALYAACSCAAMYTHYTCVFVLVAQFGWAFLAHPAARRPLLAANAGAAVCFSPWLPALRTQTRSPLISSADILTPLTPHNVVRDIGRWSIGHPFAPVSALPGRLWAALAVAGVAIAVAALGIRAFRLPPRGGTAPARSRVALVALLAVATPAGVALYSWLGPHSIWDNRQLIASWPGFALLLGALATAPPAAARLPAVALLLSAFAAGAVQTLEQRFRRPDYDAAARFIEQTGRPADPLAELPIPSPSPLSPLGDVALNRFGSGGAHPRAVLRIGFPPLSLAVRARAGARLPVPPPSLIARRAAARGRGGRIFVAVPGAPPFSLLAGRGRLTRENSGLDPAVAPGAPSVLVLAAMAQVRPFLRALPPRFRYAGRRVFPGVLPETVYVLRDTGR